MLHFLPMRAGETNPIERVRWHHHETQTRNHRCQSLDELLANVYQWASDQPNFTSQTEHSQTMYPLRRLALRRSGGAI